VAVALAGPYANLHLDPDSTMPAPYHSSFLQARCPFCRPTNSIKVLKVLALKVLALDLTEKLNC